MKIYDGDNLLTDVELCMDRLSTEQKIEYQDGVLIEYHSEVLLKIIDNLILETLRVTEPVWKYPDYEKTKTYLYISFTEYGYEYNLSIEIVPPNYSQIHMDTILHNASREKNESGFSEYEDWKEIFYEAYKFHTNSYALGTVSTYKLKPNQKEEISLENLADCLFE